MRSRHFKDQPHRPLLVVDDSPEDCESLRRILSKLGISNPVFFCTTGEQAIDYLFRSGEYVDPHTSPRPGIILLDLNLPGTSGPEVLSLIKKHESLRRIPVIVLTSSDRPADIEECYRRGANSYIQKLADLDRFRHALDTLKWFWFEQALLPEGI